MLTLQGKLPQYLFSSPQSSLPWQLAWSSRLLPSVHASREGVMGIRQFSAHACSLHVDVLLWCWRCLESPVTACLVRSFFLSEHMQHPDPGVLQNMGRRGTKKYFPVVPEGLKKYLLTYQLQRSPCLFPDACISQRCAVCFEYRDETDYNKLFKNVTETYIIHSRLYVRNVYICFMKNKSVHKVVDLISLT